MVKIFKGVKGFIGSLCTVITLIISGMILYAVMLEISPKRAKQLYGGE